MNRPEHRAGERKPTQALRDKRQMIPAVASLWRGQPGSLGEGLTCPSIARRFGVARPVHSAKG